ncbi:hypothetical protein [Leifsonia sp. LS-T14]|uniref:DUF7882 family protein n=1 Tax=unclassified Leifsonia TaxID=2663824 RepID=UPI0035A676BF
MGTLIYAGGSTRVELSDRELAHLQFVITGKLRRREGFLLSVHDSDGTLHVVWLSASLPLDFAYSSPVLPPLNREWLEVLTVCAGHAGGLRLLPEPAEGAKDDALATAQ